MSTDDSMKFTGERFLPEIEGNIYLEHMHRYFIAEQFVSGKVVLDIACGEGFGSHILARSARHVVGVDISAEAVEHAQQRYPSENISFKRGSVTSIPVESGSFDVVVSFETIEHVAEHDEMLAEFRRVLRPGGLVIISTPDKATYTDATGLTNPYHVKELYRTEFLELIRRHFAAVHLHGQRIGFGSLIASDLGSAAFFETPAESAATSAGLISPLYLIAFASDDPKSIPLVSGLFSQNIMASEPVKVRVAAEWKKWDEKTKDLRAHYERLFGPELESFVEEVDWSEAEIGVLLQQGATERLAPWKLVRRLLRNRLLLAISKIPLLSERRRARFRRSAEKRDPFRLHARLSLFCAEYLSRMGSNQFLLEYRRRRIAKSGLTITAVVPNYNHAKFLKQRLESILNQTYPNIDIIILDDCSTDNSRSVIDEFVERFPDRITAVYNDVNSGGVFRQWQKGHTLATGDLVWICESDDFCDPRFAEILVPAFRDPSVMVAFGKIEFSDADGRHVAGMDAYREMSEGGVWSEAIKRPAARWFSGAFGVRNVIANVGGSIWRRFPIDQSVWDEAGTYRVMGDWFLYAMLASGGQIFYHPGALAFFRIHGGNTSGVSAQSTPDYFREYGRVMTSLRQRWSIPEGTVNAFVDSCRSVYVSQGVGGSFDDLLSPAQLLSVDRTIPHVLIGLLGFSYGGGELFPIHLANALRKQGLQVSVLQMMDSEDHVDVRALLHQAIPVYGADIIRTRGVSKFLEEAGVSVVHSHVASVERLLLDGGDVGFPYIATLHGSYEAMEIPRHDVKRWARGVSQFVYTADRNLTPFTGLGVAAEKFVRFPNAMPLDKRPFGKSRRDLGISDDAVVFALVARGIEGKGWEETVKAARKLRARQPEREIAILAVGKGPLADRARELAADDPNLHFLGYVPEVHGVYAISDVALLPTRFSGESYPLCLIQAMQVGIPSVATDIGSIRSMVVTEHGASGEIVPYLADDTKYVDALTDAMERMLEPAHRAKLAAAARAAAGQYDMDALAARYRDLYLRTMAASRQTGRA